MTLLKPVAETSNFTLDVKLAADPATVFAAVTAPEQWWAGPMFGGTGIVEGSADRLGAEFDYTLSSFHFSRQRIVELDPGRRVVWEVLASELSFANPKDEWTGTRVVFDIRPDGAATRLHFVHEGLTPEEACYDSCSAGWRTYIEGTLKKLSETGAAR